MINALMAIKKELKETSIDLEKSENRLVIIKNVVEYIDTYSDASNAKPGITHIVERLSSQGAILGTGNDTMQANGVIFGVKQGSTIEELVRIKFDHLEAEHDSKTELTNVYTAVIHFDARRVTDVSTVSTHSRKLTVSSVLSLMSLRVAHKMAAGMHVYNPKTDGDVTTNVTTFNKTHVYLNTKGTRLASVVQQLAEKNYDGEHTLEALIEGVDKSFSGAPQTKSSRIRDARQKNAKPTHHPFADTAQGQFASITSKLSMQAERPKKSKTSSTENFPLSDTDKENVVSALRVFDNSSTPAAGALTYTLSDVSTRSSFGFADVGGNGSTNIVVKTKSDGQVDAIVLRLTSAEENFASGVAAYGVVSHRVMSRLACVGKMLQEGTLDSKGTKLMQVADACRCNPYRVRTKKTIKLKSNSKSKTRFKSALSDPLFEQARLMAFCAWRLSRKSKLGPKLKGEKSLAGVRSPVVYSYERSEYQL
jgi:hypothetical protein